MQAKSSPRQSDPFLRKGSDRPNPYAALANACASHMLAPGQLTSSSYHRSRGQLVVRVPRIWRPDLNGCRILAADRPALRSSIESAGCRVLSLIRFQACKSHHHTWRVATWILEPYI